ncbi:MAG: T9SS type B sorting domain-containing protein [Bacteroidales bacterium]|nr:T9SS type B sorting domain-containing protein [Bacteroidales bacterium]
MKNLKLLINIKINISFLIQEIFRIFRYKYKILILVSFFLLSSNVLFSQKLSKDNYTGNWMDEASWVDWIPDATFINRPIHIYGTITRYGNLSFYNGDLHVFDTLIIEGNLTLEMNCDFIIDSNAILIVYGDASIAWGPNVQVLDGGYFIVEETLSNDVQTGSFFTEDSVPNIFFGAVFPDTLMNNFANYPALDCSSPVVPYASSGCTFGDMIDLADDPIYNFYLGDNSPLIINHPHDTSLCSTENITLNIDAINIESYHWQIDEGSGFIDIVDLIHHINIDSSQLTIVNVTTDFSGNSYRCQAVGVNNDTIYSDTASLTVLEPPIANAGRDTTVCKLDYSLRANLSTGVGAWTELSGPGDASFADSSNPNSLVNVTLIGSYQFIWTETNVICEDQDTITVAFEGPIANAGTGGNSCDTTFSLAATLSSGTGGIWSIVSGSGTAVFSPSNTSTNAVVTVSDYGSYQIEWIEINGICVDNDTITVDFYEQPNAKAGKDTTVCNLDYSLNANLSSGIGVWTKLSGPGDASFADSSNSNSLVTVTLNGSYQFIWTETNVICEDQDTITVAFEGPIANAGTDGSSCDTTFSLGATLSSGTGGIWSIASGSGTAVFSPSNTSTNAVVTVSDYGSYQIEWTEINGICVDHDTIIVDFYEQPIADAGTGGSSCDTTFKLGANISSGTGTWAVISGLGTASFSPNNISANAVATVSDYGTYQFEWIETNGTCVDKDTISVVFEQQAIADAGTSGSSCDTTFSLGANISSGTGTWAVISGSGTASFSPNNTSPNALVTVSDFGTYQFQWTETNGSCVDKDTISVVFEQQQIADAGTGGSTCDTTFSLGANISSGTGTWAVISGPGTASFSPNNISTNAVATVSDYGTYQFEWIETNGSCVDKDTISVVFEQQAIADAGTDGSSCDTTFSLRANISSGTGTWAVISGSGTASFSPNNTSPNALVTVSDYGTYQFEWTETNNSCVDKDTISVVFEQPPIADAGAGGSACSPTFSLEANMSSGAGNWSVISGNGTVSYSPNNTSPKVIITISDYGTYQFEWTETNGSCIDKDTVGVVFKQQPIADAGTGGSSCDTTFVLGANIFSESGNWVLINGSGTATFSPNNTSPNALVTVFDYGTYQFEWIETNDFCVYSDTITVSFYEQAIANSGNNQFLNNKTETEMKAILEIGYSGIWQIISGFAFIEDIGSPNTKVSNIQSGENIFRWKINNGYCQDSADMIISVNEYISPTVITPNGDNKNDYFIINNIHDYGSISFIVFNGWGKEVYSSSDYKNNWDGCDKKGNQLADGTYYYIIDFGNQNIIKNYVLIKR